MAKADEKVEDAMPINLGDLVRDTISGFTGIAVTHSVGMHEAEQFCVHAKAVGENGIPIPSVWFDTARLEKVDESERKSGFGI